MPPNVLLITLDQFRADCLSIAGHPIVRTPHLDALAGEGVRFARHYSQAAPCGPGRASLYTGMYQANHRVVGNGTPLDRRFDNVALDGRRAGYSPALFGYTDQAIDPRDAIGPDDPRLFTYCGVLPGFDAVLHLPDDQGPWVEWLAELGYDTTIGPGRLLATEHERPEEHSVGAFLTDTVIDWIGAQREPWFAHVSHLRPHPPYSAPGRWATAYDPSNTGDPIAPADERPAYHAAAATIPVTAAPTDPDELAHMRAQYFGLISHADHEVGRVLEDAAPTRTVGRHGGRRHVRSRRDVGRSRADAEARILGAELRDPVHRSRSTPCRRARHGRRRVHRERRCDAHHLRRDRCPGSGSM